MPKQTIEVAELRKRLAGDLLLIDVREPGEYEAFHVPGAALHPLSQFDAGNTVAALNAAQSDEPIHVLCQRGGRALQACELLEAAGFDNTVLVQGGTEAWAEAGYQLAAGGSRS